MLDLLIERRFWCRGVLFSLPVLSAVGVDFGLPFLAGSAVGKLLAEDGLNAERCHLLRGVSFASINAGTQALRDWPVNVAIQQCKQLQRKGYALKQSGQTASR